MRLMSRASEYRDRMIANGRCPECGKYNDYKYRCMKCSIKNAVKQTIHRMRIRNERSDSQARSQTSKIA
jgi:hypothetical protein